MPQVTVHEMETHATEIMRAVREERVPYVIVEDGMPVAFLSPTPPDSVEQTSQPDNTRALALTEGWLDDKNESDEGSLNDFLALIEENRLDLGSKR